MNRWLKRCTSLLVLVVMVCGMMPTAAFSAETEHTHTYENGICTECGKNEFSTSRPAENYRWEIENGVLNSVTDANFSPNTAAVLGGSITNGVISSGRYQLTKPLALMHDQPWAVEWRGSGDWTGMLLATTSDAYDTGLPYFFKTGTDSGLVAFGYKTTQVNNYGRSLNSLGLDYTQSHTYRLENRIHPDGSNMVYLFVDNAEVGPMNCFYIGGSDEQNQIVDWLSGKDFSISALGTSSHPINRLKLEYLQVMESGHTHSYEAVVTAPTCSEPGYTTYTCGCGASYVSGYADATWHDNVDGYCSMCGCEVVRISRDDLTSKVGTVSALDGTVNTTISTGWYWDIPIPQGATQVRYMSFKTAASWGSAFLNGADYIFGVCETVEGYEWVTADIPEGATIFRHGYLSDARADENGRPRFLYVEFSNAEREIPQYKERPATGCHSFSVNVNIAPAMGDPDGYTVGTDYGYIMLPTNYTSSGEPTRLIIVCHGAGGKRSTYQSDSWKTDHNSFWTDMGYAIMDMAACPQPLTTDDRAIHYGNPTVVDCYKAGFDYVMENFNLKQDGIYVIGTSMGGLSSFQIVQSGKFPVIAQAGFCPAIDLFKQAYCAKWGSAERDYQKSHISSYFGFEGAPESFTNTFPTDAEIELYKKNFDKTVRYSPILCNVVDGDITSIFEAIPTAATGTDEAEAAVYAQLTATHPCPVLIIHSKDDSVVSYRYSQYFVDMVKRSGQEARLYTINGVNHMAWQYGKNCTLQGLNGQVTIKKSQYEVYRFIQRYEDHAEHLPWVDPAVAPTCAETGLTEGTHCASCDEVLVKQNVIPATGDHTYENGICTGCGAAQPGPRITAQPADASADRLDEVAVTVTAEGDNLTYQWFYRIPEEGDFRTSACTGDTFRTVMSGDLHGCLVYCVVTDEAGNSVRSDAAMLTIAGEALPVIRIPGDLNGDGEVNNRDLILLFRYLSGWDVQLQ